MAKARKAKKGASGRENHRRFLQRYRDKLSQQDNPKPVDRHLLHDIDEQFRQLRRSPLEKRGK